MFRKILFAAMLIVLAGASACAALPTSNTQPTAVSQDTEATPNPASQSTADSSLLIERPVPAVTVEVTGKIDWNEQLVIDGWLETDCLATGVKCYYNQSAVGKVQTIKNIEVKKGGEMVFGAYSASLEVKDLASGKTQSLSRTKGVYGVVPAGFMVVNLTITDGFIVMLDAPNAQAEFCARVAQTFAEKWALSTTFPDASWSTPYCTGTYKVPVDSDRIHGGSLPVIPTATPTK